MKPRSAKAKGTKLEKWVAAQLNAIGVPAGKQPGSGIYQDFPHDVRAMLRDGPFIVECKAWQHGWRTGDTAMGAADILVIKRNFADPCVYMPWSFFARLAGLANEAGNVKPTVVIKAGTPEETRRGADVRQVLLTGKTPRSFDKPPPGHKHRWPKRKVGK